MTRTFAVSLVAVAVAVTACHGPAPAVDPTRTHVEVTGVARVALREVDADIVELTVWNDGKDPLVVDRDGILLVTPSGARPRLLGGIAHSYTIPPGSAHEVNVRFDWSGLRSGDVVRVQLDRALTVYGKPVPVAPIELRVR